MERVGLYDLTEAKEQSLTHREEVLVDSQRVIENCYAVDWEKIRQELAREKRYEERMGVEI